MTDSQLHTLARGWLEYEELDYLLPDPHSHADIRGLIATYYEGGCRAFAQDVNVGFAVSPIGDNRPSPPKPRPANKPAWLQPPAAQRERPGRHGAQLELTPTPLVERICGYCEAQFVADDPSQLYCRGMCEKQDRDRKRIEALRGSRLLARVVAA